MNKPLKMFFIFALSLLAAESVAAEVSGKIRICRHPGLTEMLDKQSIPIPAGSSFTTSGPTSEFVVTTTDAVKLGPKPGCAVASAEITENQGHLRVTKKSGRLEAQFVIAGAELEAVVVEDFK